MKILHIAKYYEPFKGGIEKVNLELGTGSVKAGHEVVVISCNYERKYVEDDVEGVKVIRLPRFGVAFSQPLSFSFMWQVKKWIEWADVVHVHMPNPLAELAFLIQDQKKPLVVTYHCDVVQKKMVHEIYKPVRDRILQRADKIVVSTPNHLEYSEALQPYKSKCEVVPFGVRAKHAQRTLEINNKMKEFKEELGDYFLFVGRLVPYKGVDILMHALRQVDQKMVIVGNGPRWEGWYLLAQDLGIQDKVRMIGRVDDDTEFAAYIHGATAVVLPSINEAEAFGIVLIEAMSCGKPVITTKLRSGVPWVNEKGVTGLEVAPKDHHALAQAMNEMANNHEMRKQMGEAARKRFETMFTVDKMVDGYLSVYQKVQEQKKLAA